MNITDAIDKAKTFIAEDAVSRPCVLRALLTEIFRLQEENKRCTETLTAITAVNVNEFGYPADLAIKRLVDSHVARVKGTI